MYWDKHASLILFLRSLGPQSLLPLRMSRRSVESKWEQAALMFGGRPSELILRPAWLSKPQPPRMTATPSHFCFFFVLFSISQIVQYEHLLLQMVVVVGRTNTLKKKKVPRLFCLANVINRNSTLSFTKDLNFPPTFKQFNSFIIAAG